MSGLWQNGLDYQKSKYNFIRLEDFIRLYGLAVQQNGDTAEQIIQLAEKMNLKLPEVRERTQLDAVKDYLQKTAEQNGYQKAHQLWMPVLRTHTYLKEFAEYQERPLQMVSGSRGGGWSLKYRSVW